MANIQHPTVYVMQLPGSPNVRVGHHTTTNVNRQSQVKGGSGHPWKITFCICVKSKLEAAAVEAAAHLFLSKHATIMTTLRVKNGVPVNQHVFKCTQAIAIKAIKDAVKILSTHITIIPCASCTKLKNHNRIGRSTTKRQNLRPRNSTQNSNQKPSGN